MSTYKPYKKTGVPTGAGVGTLAKVAVGAPSLIDAEVKQFELFNRFDNKDTLNNTLDQLSDRFGKGVIGFACQQRSYHERQGEIEMLELENYYTDIKDIVVVKCV